ncbi:MAG: glycosyltransferase family 39 protein [Candidatus Hydrogenedentota bacterium]
MESTKQFNWRLAGLLLVALALFAVNLDGYDLWPADEPRFGQVSREMMRSGDFLAPHVNGLAYREKPPLLFWLISLASIPFGDVTEFSSRVPSVVAGLLTLALTYALARRMFGGQTAIWALIVLATCERFWWQSRTVQIDMLLTLCMTAALYSLWRWHESRERKWLVALYAAMAAGMYAKGPPALVFPLLFIAAFYWKQPTDRRQTHWVVGALAVIATFVLWLIPARLSIDAGQGSAAGGDIMQNIQRQTVGRLFTIGNHAQPPWYFLQTLPVDWLPWTLFAPFTIFWAWRHRNKGPEMRFLHSWIVPALIFFSISIGKRAIYILPLFPAMSILFSRSILVLIEEQRSRYAIWAPRAWGLALLVLGATPIVMRYTEYAAAVDAKVIAFAAVSALLGACVIAASFQTYAPHKIIAASLLVILPLTASIAFPALNPYKSARGICAPVRELVRADADFDLYSIGFSREVYVYYSDRFHKPLVNDVLDLDLPEGTGIIETFTVQLDLKKAVSHAVREVPIENVERVTEAEIAALLNATEKALAAEKINPALRASFESAIAAETAPLAADRPAIAFVQEMDYRWLLPLSPALQSYKVLQFRGVGSRDVLLLANASAVALLESLGIEQ